LATAIAERSCPGCNMPGEDDYDDVGGDHAAQACHFVAQWIERRNQKGSSCYEEGRNVPSDEAEALRWYKRAAAAGWYESAVELYRRGLYADALPLCIFKATTATTGRDKFDEWGRRLPPRNVRPQACHILAECHEFGLGVAADKTEAIRWYKLAVEAGDLGKGCNTLHAALYDLHRLGEYVPATADEHMSLASFYRYGWSDRVSQQTLVSPDMKEALRLYVA
jgi:TPR repeat protein